MTESQSVLGNLFCSVFATAILFGVVQVRRNFNSPALSPAVPPAPAAVDVNTSIVKSTISPVGAKQKNQQQYVEEQDPKMIRQIATIGKRVVNAAAAAAANNNTITNSAPRRFLCTELATLKIMHLEEFDKILKDKSAAAGVQVVDVREKDELAIVSIPSQYVDIINLPLSEAGDWAPKIVSGQLLDSDKTTLCLCHHGARSMRFGEFLVSKADFSDVYNIQGGVAAYADVIDSSIGRY